MGANLENFNEIIYHQYRPWLMDYSDFRYLNEWNLLKPEEPPGESSFEVMFPKPLNGKRKFFKRLIENEAICFLKQVHHDIQNGDAPIDNQLTIHCAIKKNLHVKLRAVAAVIAFKKYLPSQYQRQEVYFSCENKDADDSYIMDFLKHQLVRLLLEVQKSYREYLREEELDEEDIYMTFFDHNTPGCIVCCIEEEESPGAAPRPPKKAFVPCMHDLREPPGAVLTYEEAISNPHRFLMAEQEFFNSGFISDDYVFIEKRGRKREFAMVVNCLIEKGYFNKYKHPGKRLITTPDIRRFLEHRYALDFDKIFRMSRNDPEGIREVTSRYRWLDIIYSR